MQAIDLTLIRLRTWEDRVVTLSNEMWIALSNMGKTNLIKVLTEIILTALKFTWRHKVDLGRELYQSISKSLIKAKSKIRQYKSQGFKESMKKDYESVKRIPKSVYNKTIVSVKDFLSLDVEQKKLVLKDTFVYTIFFIPSLLIIAGGRDFEGGVPDSDIPVGKFFGKGLGWHRNPLSHTFIMGLGIEVLVRMVFGLAHKVYNYLPEKHDKIWDRMKEVLPTAESATIAGAWLGIALHLLKDSGILTKGFEGNIFRYRGLPFKMADDVHQSILATSGIIGGGISLGEIKKKIKKKPYTEVW